MEVKYSSDNPPSWVGVIFGVLLTLAGAGVLALYVSWLRAQGASPAALPLMGATFLSLGLTVSIGAFFGLDSEGRRPVHAPRVLRVLHVVCGWIGGIGFASMFTAMALFTWDGDGRDALIGRLVFGAFAVLFWAAVIGGGVMEFVKRKKAADADPVSDAFDWTTMPRAVRIALSIMGLGALATFAAVFSLIALGQTETPISLALPIPVEWLGGMDQALGRLVFGLGALMWWGAFVVLAHAVWRGLRR